MLLEQQEKQFNCIVLQYTNILNRRTLRTGKIIFTEPHYAGKLLHTELEFDLVLFLVFTSYFMQGHNKVTV